MTDQKMLIPEPAAPCQKCVENPVEGNDQLAIVWCPHHRYGGMYFSTTACWHISGPFQTDLEFRRSLAHTLRGILGGQMQ